MVIFCSKKKQQRIINAINIFIRSLYDFSHYPDNSYWSKQSIAINFLNNSAQNAHQVTIILITTTAFRFIRINKNTKKNIDLMSPPKRLAHAQQNITLHNNNKFMQIFFINIYANLSVLPQYFWCFQNWILYSTNKCNIVQESRTHFMFTVVYGNSYEIVFSLWFCSYVEMKFAHNHNNWNNYTKWKCSNFKVKKKKKAFFEYLFHFCCISGICLIIVWFFGGTSYNRYFWLS